MPPGPSLPPALPHTGQARTPAAFARAIVQAYAQHGKSPDAALALAQIAPAHIRQPHARITALQLEHLSAAAMHELDDEALGWFSRRLPWGSYGMLVRASLSAGSLELALRRWCRHHQLLTDDIGLQLSVHNGVASLELQEHRDLGTLREFCIVSVLRNALGVACWLSDSRITLLHTALRFPAPMHHDCYAHLFEGPCQFDAAHNMLQFDAGYLRLPIRRDESALQRMLARPLLLTVRPYRRDRLLVERVQQALAQLPALGHNAERLAAHLNVSTRTLHRQLREEGSTLQKIKDQVRRDAACELLMRSQRGIKQIAEATGFRNEKSFIRAFKKWTGQPPDAFRHA